MSYLEKKQVKDKKYVYFVKKISFMKSPYIIKKLIGTSTITKEKYILDNIELLSNEEFNFRKKFLNQIKEKVTHNEILLERIEKKAIKINNLIEGKQCQKPVYIEFSKEFIFNSNNIEGSKIPVERVREIIDTGDTKYKNRNEIKEVKNSIEAFNYLQKSFKFNVSSIKRLYHILTKDLTRDGNELYPKGFKKESNIVGNSSTTSPENVENELKELIIWYKKNKNKIHPLVLAFEFHKKYEMIHPFLDGNGRTGRLIMNKILMNNGYLPIIIYKENKQAYFYSIEKSIDGKTKNYYQFMLEQADKSYDFLMRTIEKY